MLAAFSLSAQSIQIGSWKTDEFTKTYTEKTWDFSQNISAVITKSGTYNIVFTYTGGRHKLCLKEAIIKADGKEVLSVAGERSAGTNPKLISYTFELGAVPNKLTLTAKARTDGGTNSNGKIELTVSDVVGGILTIPEGTTEIKNYAYYGNTALKKVIIPSTVTKIGGMAFHNCPNLVEIDIPSSVTAIGDAAFQNCTALSKVTLHEGLSKINLKAFKNTAITEITIPSSVTEFGSELFNDCKNLTAIKVDKYSEAHAALSTYSSVTFTNNKPKQTKEQWINSSKYNILDDGILYIAKGVKKIQDGQYRDNKDITEIRFLDTTTKMAGIGTSAFRNCTGLKKVVIPGNVRNVADWAFSGCSNLEEVIIEEGVEKIIDYAFNRCKKLLSVTLPKSIKSIGGDDIMGNKGKRIYHCWLGSKACSAVIKRYCRLDVIGIDEENIDNIDLKQISIVNTTIKDGLFRNLPFERIDIADNLTEIGKNAFNDKTVIRAKRNTATDKCLRANGYYLCGVLSDVNIYTKDKSKEIKEDFTRVLSDYDPYWKWSTYKVNTYQPLILEEVDDMLVITSVMLNPCKNVTVTDKNGKALISNKTIQPFTRMKLCSFDFLTDSVDNYTLTVNDDFYNKLIAGKVKWDMSFDFAVRRTTTPESVSTETFRPAYAREFIAGMYNVAYIIGSEEYERRCYEAVDKKLLVTDEALTVPLTREQMDKLLKKTKKWSFILGRDNIAGTGGGNILTMATDFILSFSKGAPSAFWHEFSHCMGWGHNHGNMCYEGRPEPYNVDWPSIGSYLYQEEYKKGNTPYTYDKYYLNSFFFSQPDIFPPDVEPDVVKDDTLYIADGMPKSGTFKKRTDFTKVVIPSSVSLISNSAFSGTLIKEVTIPSEVGKIGNNAFNSCNELESVIIPNSVKILGNEAFQNCVKLSTAKIGSGLRQLNSKLFKGAGLTNITIPGNIKFIDKEAFQDCKKLSKIVIEDGVRKIGNSAFNGTAIKEIKIPESVTEIGKNIVPKETVWIVKKGSYAESYCTENNIEFKYAE